MGVKMARAFYDVMNHIITVADAERLDPRGANGKTKGILTHHINCTSCGVPLSWVHWYTTGDGDDTSKVSSHFKLLKNHDHNAKCDYTVARRVLVIARESEGMLQSIGKELWEFRVQLLKDALESIARDKGHFNGNTEDRGNKTSAMYKTHPDKLWAYLSSASELMKLRFRIEDGDKNRDIAAHVVLHFGNKKINWRNFYFERKGYPKGYQWVKGHKNWPIFVEGVVNSIDPKTHPYVLLRLKPPAPKGDINGFYIARLRVFGDMADDIKIGDKICAFGLARSYEGPPDGHRQYFNIDIDIYDNRQIAPNVEPA